MTNTTKITEITDRAACAVWSPLTAGFVALGGKVSFIEIADGLYTVLSNAETCKWVAFYFYWLAFGLRLLVALHFR